MMLPILISVSVAPGSYFFWALALLATATASSPANAADVTWLKTRMCIEVLPDRGSCSLCCGAAWRAFGTSSMHHWVAVASKAFAAILRLNFRAAEQVQVPRRGSNGCQTRRAENDHDETASNESRHAMNPAQKAL